eukprot:TRINITY_DN19640_c0_g2_i1.p1 TRINITY_DN19640_c0_g2~~TRINITY_DN19640_c0_g2_i1.p1  ORF type:complete len:520 (-),score=76.84 TRINITY_DN19640_c0_g2_i1:244-1803(-)
MALSMYDGVYIKNTFVHCSWSDAPTCAPPQLKKSSTCPAGIGFGAHLFASKFVDAQDESSSSRARAIKAILKQEETAILPATPALHIKNTFIEGDEVDSLCAPPPLHLSKAETCPALSPPDAMVEEAELARESAQVADASDVGSPPVWPETPSSHWIPQDRHSSSYACVPPVGIACVAIPIACVQPVACEPDAIVASTTFCDDKTQDEEIPRASVHVKHTFIETDLPESPTSNPPHRDLESCPASLAPALLDSVSRSSEKVRMKLESNSGKANESKRTPQSVRQDSIRQHLTVYMKTEYMDTATAFNVCVDSLPVDSAKSAEFALQVLISEVLQDRRSSVKGADLLWTLMTRHPVLPHVKDNSELPKFSRIVRSACEQTYIELLKATENDIPHQNAFSIHNLQANASHAQQQRFVALLTFFSELILRRCLPLQVVDEIAYDLLWPDDRLPQAFHVECGCWFVMALAKTLDRKRRGSTLLKEVLSRVLHLKKVVGPDGSPLLNNAMHVHVEMFLSMRADT